MEELELRREAALTHKEMTDTEIHKLKALLKHEVQVAEKTKKID